MTSKFVNTDPGDPEAPRVLTEYVTNPRGHLITPGLVVTYVNDAMPGLGNPTPEGGPMEVAELILYPDAERPYVAAILDGGHYECSADNLVPVEAVREEPGGAWVESSPAARGASARRAAGLPEDAAGARTALGLDDSPGPAPPEATDNAAGPGAKTRRPPGIQPGPRPGYPDAASPGYPVNLPGEWPNLSVCTAAAFAAYEAIQSGEWDPYLPILAGAIAGRRRLMAAAGYVAVKAAGGDPDDPDDPAWATVDRAWRPPRSQPPRRTRP